MRITHPDTVQHIIVCILIQAQKQPFCTSHLVLDLYI